MATQSPTQAPVIITIPANTNEHILNLRGIAKVHPELGAKVNITNISAPVQFLVVPEENGIDKIDSTTPSYTTTDSIILTVYGRGEIHFKGAAGSETFEVHV